MGICKLAKTHVHHLLQVVDVILGGDRCTQPITTHTQHAAHQPLIRRCTCTRSVDLFIDLEEGIPYKQARQHK